MSGLPGIATRLTGVLVAWCALGLGVHAQPPPVVVRHPAPEVRQDQRGDYPTRLLALALASSGEDYRLEPSRQAMSKGRAILELSQGSPDIDILWAVTSEERERLLLPIRIPIDRGLIGWRVALIRAADADRFAKVRSLEALRAFVGAQGHDWPDLSILRASGLQVTGVNTYLGLFQMLARGRFDYLPRSLVEAQTELAQNRDLALAIAPGFVLHYPTPLYFFVNRERPELAEAVRRGLEKAMADGSFERLFQSAHARHIEQAHLAQRTVLQLDNPLLPADTPLDRRELWWQPEPAKPAPASAARPGKGSKPAPR